ncbi:4Fe-4S binding protein [Desulfovibrio aminophilus]|uniref:4Fe-4S binding protein n=1 Tax=Desulfovibrio aminophilus TaxID=81425 RepID=UPI00339B6C5E
MTLKEIHERIREIGCLTFTTLDGGTPHSRIAHVCGCDERGLYFLNMSVKPFYRQLKANGKVALCGIFPSGRPTGKNPVGQPAFEPGYTLRITGEAEEVPLAEIEAGAAAGDATFRYVLEDHARYPDIRLFRLHRGKGEIYDYDFEMERRDHKLLRTRFSFGGETHEEPGCRITDACVACGACAEICTFKAVVPGEPYRIDGARCDECGSCILACPEGAIEPPRTI